MRQPGRACLSQQAWSTGLWISYEISHAWNEGKGVVGIYIHNLRDLKGNQARKGQNPLDHVTFTASGKTLSSIAKTYDPPYTDSKQAYAYIANNLSSWIEEAIRVRGNS